MSEVDIFDKSKRYEDLVDTYSVDPKTGKAKSDAPLSQAKRKKRPRRRRRRY
jgi:hypothetical protein